MHQGLGVLKKGKLKKKVVYLKLSDPNCICDVYKEAGQDAYSSLLDTD